MRTIGKIITALLILVGMIIISALLISRFYEDEIIRYAIDGINRQIRTRVDVENVKLSLLKKFPDASLEFENIYVISVPEFNDSDFKGNTDTLLFARQLYLQFNVYKLLKKQYLLKEVQLSSGKLKLLTDKSGGSNYEFWTDRKGNKEFLLELDNVKLTDIRLAYLNHAMDMESSFHIRKTTLKGKFSEVEHRLDFNIEGIIQKYIKEGVVFVKDQNLLSSAKLDVNPKSVSIPSGMLELAGQRLIVDGSIDRGAPLGFQLTARGDRLNLEKIVQYLASANDKIPENLRAGGELSFDATISGSGSRTLMPGITADFTIRNGWILGKNGALEIRQIETQGKYSNGYAHTPATSTIALSNSSLEYGNSRIGGDFHFSNLVNPTINHNIKLELNLADIQDFIKGDSLILDLKGILMAELTTRGTQSSILKFSRDDMLNNEFEFRMGLEDAGFRLPHSLLEFKDIKGDMVYGDFLNIETLSGSLGDNYVSFSGRGDNLKEFLFTKKGNLWLDLDVYSDNADLNTLLDRRSEKGNEKSFDSLHFPERIFIKSRFWFDDLGFRDFSASNVMGDVFYKPGRLTVNSITLSSMEGLIKAEGLIEQQSGNQTLVKVISDVSRVDIKKGFASFKNFGQEFIMDKHLNGSLSGQVHFSALFDGQMKIKKESILSDCDIVIRNGALSGFEPMQKLSRFIEVEELGNVSFSTLTNQIFIRNQEILIPRMDINSSAFGIEGSGVHGFDKNFEYKVKVSLSELLAGKVKRTDQQVEEFGYIEDDGLGRAYAYLLIIGTPEGIDIKYDRKGAIGNIRYQLQEEKTVVREILNEEFGLFKNDSTLFREEGIPDSPGYIIMWEEDATGDSLKKDALTKNNKTQGPGFTIRWDEDEQDETDTLELVKKKRKSLFKRLD